MDEAPRNALFASQLQHIDIHQTAQMDPDRVILFGVLVHESTQLFPELKRMLMPNGQVYDARTSFLQFILICDGSESRQKIKLHFLRINITNIAHNHGLNTTRIIRHSIN